MKNINRVIVSGNLTREPELRHTPSGLAVLNIGVAVNDSRKNQNTGEWEEYPNYIDCVVMGDRAEKLANMLHKGQKVCVEGKLRYSSWEKEGQKRSKIEVNVDQIEFMSRRDDEPQVDTSLYDEDIPF
jgi:single-strand DNA-binding protein